MRSSTRATSLGSERARKLFGRSVSFSRVNVPAVDHLLAQPVELLVRSVTPVHVGRSAQLGHLCHPLRQTLVLDVLRDVHPRILADDAPGVHWPGRAASRPAARELPSADSSCAGVAEMTERSPSRSAPPATPTRVAVLTSGGDSAGMNAAVRAAVRTALAADLEAFAVYEGLQGLIDGGDRIRPLSSADVGGILHHGGTVLGTARSPAFRTRDGLRRAARNLVERGIDALVVIGGDGSLSGAAELRTEWSGLLDELVADRRRRPRRRPTPIGTSPWSGWSAPSTTTCSAPT